MAYKDKIQKIAEDKKTKRKPGPASGLGKKEPEIRLIMVDEDGKMLDKPEYIKEYSKGGRVNLSGGGCAKRGVKKNAYGKNS